MASSTCWMTYCNPDTLVGVGGEALCMKCDNVLLFRDLKTGNTSYYKCEGPQILSVSIVTGHNRLLFVAIAERTVNPAIHILQYPQLTKYCTFANNEVLSFIDMKFNEYDLLVALSGYPLYTICIWNFRTGQKIVHHNTNVECTKYALTISPLNSPQILQYSDWHKKIILWEIRVTDTGADLYQIYKKFLPKEHNLTHIKFSFCYTDDNVLYYVDCKGQVSSIEIGLYYFKSRWFVPQEKKKKLNVLNYYKLFYHKHGFLVSSPDKLYYIKKKTTWQMEWKIDLRSTIYRMVSTIHGEVYASTDNGNLYHLEASAEGPELKIIDDFHRPSISYAVVRGGREESILQMTEEFELRALAIPNRHIYSIIKIPGVSTTISHNLYPYIVVGTEKGALHFLNYDKPTDPVEVCVLQSEEGHPLRNIFYADKVILVMDASLNFYIFQVDFPTGVFRQMALVDKVPPTHMVLDSHMNDDLIVFIFVRPRESDILYPHASDLWLYNCYVEKKEAKRRKFPLPYKYRSFTKLTASVSKIADEFAAARFGTPLIDIIHFRNDTDQLLILQTIRTNHVGGIVGLVGTRNIVSWGMDASFLQYRLHKKTSKMYAISQHVAIKHKSKAVRKARECFGSKYYIVLYMAGDIKAMKINTSTTIFENSLKIESDSNENIIAHDDECIMHLYGTDRDVVIEYSPEEHKARNNLLQQIESLGKEVTALIDYDIKVAGKSNKMFRKFCLNHEWLKEVTAEAEQLCKIERRSLTESIEEQSRIRDWIYNLIMRSTTGITYRIRTIFSDFAVDNYGMRIKNDIYAREYDLFRFYDMEPLEVEVEEDAADLEQLVQLENDNIDIGPKIIKKHPKYYVIKGNAYDHVMCDELALQDIDQVTAHQMFNQTAKYKTLLVDLLKVEFNKRFDEARKLKSDLIESILQTNATLVKIYDNMNCMLQLLNLPLFQPPPLTVPEWQKDEVVKRIMEVDDSEIKAINRRKKKVEEVARKRGRMLLWSVEFWVRALQVMMDGVLEKLWEEEIKKNIPLPEFMIKKQPVEFTLEDQKMLREYEDKVRLLTEDRKKYLRILTENEVKSKIQKNSYILQMNQHITEMMITKLKYDFAIRHINLRNGITTIMHSNRLKVLKKITELRSNVENITDLIARNIRFSEQFNKSVEDFRAKLESCVAKERTIDRQFKNQFLNLIPQQFTAEMTKAYRRRPKLPIKMMNSILNCRELSVRINAKPQSRYAFPLPKDCNDYLDTLNVMDEYNNMAVIDQKHWEQFIKLRRQKIEMELKIKALHLQLADIQALINNSIKDLQSLRNLKGDVMVRIQTVQNEYINIIQDQPLEVRLTMGQVETNILTDLSDFQKCILMQEDDINDINDLILKAGQKKLKAMERVAFFRRQVIYKEWEHKMVSANITYLQYILKAVGKCKVSLEFLHILRNWEKTKANKERMQNAVGLIEKACADKLIAFQKSLQDILNQIAQVRGKVNEMKRNNQRINRQVDEVKVSIALSNANRDFLIEEKRTREQKERMKKIKKHTQLVEIVRSDYVKILELKTILELERLRTYPTLGPNPNQCSNPNQ